MSFQDFFSRVVLLWAVLAASALAATDRGDLVVRVVRAADDQAVAGASVRVLSRDRSRTLFEAQTDQSGEVRIAGVPIGDLFVVVEHPEEGADGALLAISSGTDNFFEAFLSPETTVEVVEVRDNRLLVNSTDPNAGATTMRDREFIQRLTDRGSLPAVLATVPGTASNSLGQVHVRGEHRALSLSLDGVDLPLATAGSTTQSLDPEFIEAAEVTLGNFDASRGGQTGAVINARTPGEGDDPFVDLTAKVGDYGQSELLLKAGGSNDSNTFTYFVGARRSTSDVYLEAPTPRTQDLNNRGELLSFLLRLNGRQDKNRYGMTLSHQSADFGIPQTPENFAAGVRQGQQDSNTLALASWSHELTEDDDLLFALALQKNDQRVRSNGVFTPYFAVPEGLQEELASDRFPLDPERPGSPYLPTTDLSILQIKPSLDFTHRFAENHRLKAGLTANFIDSEQRLSITDPGGGGGLPNPVGLGVPVELLAAVSRSAFNGGIYLDHTYPLGESVVLNYGLRAETFDNGAGVSTGQLSPRLNLSYAPTEQQALRLSYNRLFQPPPIELDVSGQTEVLPQRTHLYELSYENQFAPSLVGKIAFVYKDFQDQVDIGLLIPNSNIPVFAPINFARAEYKGIEASLTSTNSDGWNGFLALTVSEARPTEGSIFSGPPPEFNDHDQRVQATAGVSYTWENGLSTGVDVLYASGFPQEGLPLYNSVGIQPFGFSGERVDRFITNFNLEYRPQQRDGGVLGGGIQVFNVFNDRSLVNLFSEFSGSRYVTGRRFMLNLNARF
jgi:outer membrane receptor protein involved in Fe transport